MDCPKCKIALKKYKFTGTTGDKGGWFIRYNCPKCRRYWTSEMVPLGYMIPEK
jgi:transposase-like protein